MISVIGCGGAGGNIADEAVKLGFYGASINYSERDLNSLEHVQERLQLEGSEGVGKNRNLALELLTRQYDKVINWIKERFSSPDIKILAFSFSTSGGSGSGISPLLIDMVHNAMPEKVVIALPILPDESEDETSQLNCLATFEELSRMDIGILPIDNQQIKKLNPNISKNKLYDISNTSSVYLLHLLTSYVQKSSKSGNFDEKDLLTVLQTRGIIHICETNFIQTDDCDKQTSLSQQKFIKQIHDQWELSVFTPMEYNYVARAGVIFDGDERLSELISHKQIFSVFNTGLPVSIYEGF